MMPRNDAGKADRAADYNRSDGFSPGQTIVTHGAGARPRGAAEPCPSTTSRQGLRAARADRRDRRQDRQAPADLGRARLAGQGPARRALLDPSRAELARGPALHRGAAQPRDKRGTRAAGPPALPRLSRRLRGPRQAGRATSRTSSAALAQGGHPPREPLPGLGLHRRRRRLAQQPHAVDPQPRLRRARRPRPRRPRSRRARRRPSPSTRSPRTSATCGAWRAPSPSRASSTRPAARPARASSSAAAACRVRIPGNVQEERFICLVPDARHQRRGRSSSGTACSARGRGGAPAGGARQRGNFVVCATDWSGMSREDVPNALDALQGPVALPDARRPHCSRASSTSCSWAGDDPPAGASPRNPAFSREDRHAPALLRRRQPGRDPRRRANRGRAGLRALGADRAGA